MFRVIGELGRAQVNLLMLLSLPGAWIASHTFITNFIGSAPRWTCSVANSESGKFGRIDDDDFAVHHSVSDLAGNCSSSTVVGGAHSGCDGQPVLVTDPEEKCRHYERGDCLPAFDTTEYTSIVSEVS